VEPFPAYRRRIYFGLSVILFLALLPVVILYADGWRFKQGFGLVRTGGIYIAVPYNNATVTFNGERVGQSGFLQRDFYIGDLAPAAYSLRVEGGGVRPWSRILVVEPQLVTDARAILLPEEVTLVRLVTSGNASSTKLVSTDTYYDYLVAFATSTVIASTTLPVDERGDIGLFIDEDGDLIARWMRQDHPHSAFCGSPSLCEREMSIKRIGGPATDAHFFGGGVVYRTEEGGIYFTEIDIRPTAVSAQLYAAADAEMRLLNDSLIIKSDDLLYEVEGL
jgi:hypothetical protein